MPWLHSTCAASAATSTIHLTLEMSGLHRLMAHSQRQLHQDPELLEKLLYGAILISFGLVLIR
jgi:hypothetical protein